MWPHGPVVVASFVDDVGLCRPKTTGNNKKNTHIRTSGSLLIIADVVSA